MTSSSRVLAHGNTNRRQQGTQACRHCRRRKVKVLLPSTLHKKVSFLNENYSVTKLAQNAAHV